MTEPKPKTYEEHCRYLHQIVKLKLWFLFTWLKAHPEEPFLQALEQRVDIYRKTDLNDGDINPTKLHYDAPAWLKLVAAARQVYGKYKDDPDPARFEPEAFAVFRPTIEARARRDYETVPYVKEYNAGSFHVVPPGSRDPGLVFIHIANARAPRSFLDDPRHVAESLARVMEIGEREYKAKRVCTGTWLNSCDRFLRYFPQEWQKNMGPEQRSVQWHYGFWGQFITARGTFNEKLGQQLRRTGQFPFWPRDSWCTFKALKRHLQTFI